MTHLTRCLSLSILFAATSSLAAQESIKIVGSTTVRPVVERMVREYQKADPACKFEVEGGGSSTGVKEAGAGNAQVGMVSRSVKSQERETYKDLVEFQVGIDGLAIVVSKKNTAKNLTKQQLADIFSGKITNWKDVGGADAPIEPICCGVEHGTFEAFATFLGFEGKQTEDGKSVVLTQKGKKEGVTLPLADGNKALIGAVMSKPNAIVCASAGAATAAKSKGAPIGLLSLDGTEPSDANIASGKYAFQRPLYFVTKGEPSAQVRKFLDFALGAEGQKIVQSLELHPVAPTK